MPSLKANGKRLNGKGGGWIAPARRLAIYLRDGFACAYCGRDLHDVSARERSLDHLVPQCKGGSHESSNLVTACTSCNSKRQHTPWRQYATGGAVERIARLRRRAVNVERARAIIAGKVPALVARAERASFCCEA
jgi:5-methylcytosine-specific restriction endonuclease McrA